MARVCELSGKKVMTGNNVSHANNKTKRKFLPNLNNVSLVSEKLDLTVRFKVSANALRSVEHAGGLDNFLLKSKDINLSSKAKRLKNKILKGYDTSLIFFPNLPLWFSSNKSANCSVIAPPSCSASTIVTALF